MHKFTTLALALAIAAPSGVAMAQSHGNDHGNHGARVSATAHAEARGRSHGAHVSAVARSNPFRAGQRFDRARAPHYSVVSYRSHRHLSAPPRGYRWVRSGDDALLVAIRTGVIRSVVRGVF
ncbi:MAG: hypothetical protein RIS94_3415 [Pseudomonadota bacterium]|jgi:Ni/Co efflux regulator RcnB